MKCLPRATRLAVSEGRWGPALLLHGVETFLSRAPSPRATYCLFPGAGIENLRVLVLCQRPLLRPL